MTPASPSPSTAAGVRSVTRIATVPPRPAVQGDAPHPGKRLDPGARRPQVDVHQGLAQADAGSRRHRLGRGVLGAGDLDGAHIEQGRAQGEHEAQDHREDQAQVHDAPQAPAAGVAPHLDPAAPGSAGRSPPRRAPGPAPSDLEGRSLHVSSAGP